MKHKFKISPNTDMADIAAMSLGLSVSVGDVNSPMLKDRGLTIQIKHNKDKATFEAANQISQLIATAPELLEQLKVAAEYFKNNGGNAAYTFLKDIHAAIAKAEGKID